ncbi:LTA synthase family protein [Paenibacillus filicis]|uniref:LTA synthase family protein n=1 Tax=Paenibacillus gyeongsangnamensis TaxID=3388067 RepID=A0ABT4Q2C8_9BACL|nr:LTA synthase family protein [Paenibacillus filicis]MCZ8511043.1 LTA synthase family protein [Paenibacillus filicis]
MSESRQAVFWRSAFLLTLVLLTAKLALLRHFLFQEVKLRLLATDVAALLVLLGLVELLVPSRAKKTVYWLVNFVCSLIFFAATLYFSHFGTVVTYTSLFELKQVKQISSSIKSTIDPIDYVFFVDLGLMIVVSLLRRRSLPPLLSSRPLRKTGGALMVAGLLLSAWFFKKGEPINNELKRAEELGFFNYQVASVYDNYYNNDLTKYKTVAELRPVLERGESKYPYMKPLAEGEQPQQFAAEKGKNLIVVQLEALQAFPIGMSLNGQALTPVLNDFASRSYYFPHIFQQIGQGNTSDAEFMSNTSIYPTGTIPMSTGFGDRALPSLPKLLEAASYEADTFHVNVVTFWDRNKLYPALGFSHYYDKPYYNNDHFNEFGASDEELYREVIKVLSGLQQQNKPFYAQLITVSSHFPFIIPENKKRLTLPDKLKGKQLGDYLQAINYTDFAFGTFIEQLKATGLWDNSVIVAYGDHFGLQPQDNDPKEVGAALGITYHPELTRFNIPLFIHLPGQEQGQVVEQVGGQLDIMPTLANLLGISLEEQQFVHFGHDLLNMNKNLFGIRYYLPTGSFINDDILLIPGKGFGDATAYSIKTLQPISDFSMYQRDYKYILRRMQVSDHYVKLLPKR